MLKYGTIVDITKGFYEGQRGTIVDYICESIDLTNGNCGGIIYDVEIKQNKIVQIFEDKLNEVL